MIRVNKKDFIFRQANCTMNVLHLSLLKSFVLSICSKDPMKNSTLGILLQDYLQLSASQVPTMMSLWKMISVCFNLKFLILTLRHMFCSSKPSNISQERDFVSSASQNKLKKHTFLWFKKETFWWEEIKWILPKNMLSTSVVDIIFFRTFLL